MLKIHERLPETRLTQLSVVDNGEDIHIMLMKVSEPSMMKISSVGV